MAEKSWQKVFAAMSWEITAFGRSILLCSRTGDRREKLLSQSKNEPGKLTAENFLVSSFCVATNTELARSLCAWNACGSLSLLELEASLCSTDGLDEKTESSTAQPVMGSSRSDA